MVQHNVNEWSYTLDATKLVGDQIEVKFFIKSNDSNENLVWEYSDNRTLLLPTMDEGDVVVYELTEASFPLPAVSCCWNIGTCILTSFGDKFRYR